jgi:hypothetical protein
LNIPGAVLHLYEEEDQSSEGLLWSRPLAPTI